MQGNRSGLVAWITTSTPMINYIKAQRYQIIFTSAISNYKALAMGYVLVNNTDLVRGKLYDSPGDIEEIACKMQRAIDT